jgi:Flp pilus assembly protein TadG
MVFVILGFAALTIDLGIAMATRRQMQSAADTAALEALRQRDSETETQRRQAASDLAFNVYAVFDPSQPPGAGPTAPSLEYTGGIDTGTLFKASQLMTVSNRPLVALNLNVNNDPTGDMVSGSFIAGGLGVEQSRTYMRDDFTPDPAGAATPGSAFLVRLRRTGEPSVLGVSFAGPRFPYLFALGSLLNPTLKAQGIAVRATAIASGQPVMSVGRPNASFNTPGVTPFVLQRATWENLSTLPPDAPITADSQGGQITIKNQPVGYVFIPQPVTLVGQSTASSTTPLVFTNSNLWQYVPIIQTFTVSSGGTQDRIIGFGRVDIAPGTGTQLTITRRVGKIGPANASTVLMGPFEASLIADPAQLNALLGARSSLQFPLLAPALVR